MVSLKSMDTDPGDRFIERFDIGEASSDPPEKCQSKRSNTVEL